MVLKCRLNDRTCRNIELIKEKYFEPQARVTRGYLIGLASQSINELSDEALVNAARISAVKEEGTSASTSITLRQEVFEALQMLQKRLESLYDPMVMARVIEVLVIAFNANEMDAGKKDSKIVDALEQAVRVGIDHMVFKNSYELCTDTDEKQLLYTQVRKFLETDPKGIELCQILRKDISASIQAFSDYYNPERYFPPRRRTLGTTNITYVSKVVAGFLMIAAEAEGIPVDQIIKKLEH